MKASYNFATPLFNCALHSWIDDVLGLTINVMALAIKMRFWFTPRAFAYPEIINILETYIWKAD